MRYPSPRTGDRSPREAFDDLVANAAASDAIDAIAHPLNWLMESGIWAGLRPGVQQPIMKNFLAAAMRNSGVLIDSAGESGSRATLGEYVHYLSNCFSLRLHMTDSRDPIVLQHLNEDYANELRVDRNRTVEEIRRVQPVIFVVIGIGIVYWDRSHEAMEVSVAQTSLLMPIRQIEQHVQKNPSHRIALNSIQPTTHRRNQEELAAALAKFSTECAERNGSARDAK